MAGDATRRDESRLPGVLAELVRSGELSAGAPGLAALVSELDPAWWAIATDGVRLDQVGWPTRFDVELTRRAVGRMAPLDPAVQPLLDEVTSWLDAGTAAPALEARRGVAFAAALGASLADVVGTEVEALQLLVTLRPFADAEERRWFLKARRLPAGERAVCHLAAATRVAADGWLAYHAHRSLPSEAAAHAAPAIRLALRTGKVAPADLVAWARELVAMARAHVEVLGRSLCGKARAENLDAFVVEPAAGLYLVVDGAIDRRATDAVTRAFVEAVRQAVGEGRAVSALGEAVECAHAAVRAEAPGAVAELAALLLAAGRAFVASVGACRCHHARRGEVRRLTRDDVHAIVEHGAPPGPASSDPPFPSPRVLGGEQFPRVSVLELAVEPGDTFLLSTDRLAWYEDDEARVNGALARGADSGPLLQVLDRLGVEGCAADDDCTALLVRLSR